MKTAACLLLLLLPVGAPAAPDPATPSTAKAGAISIPPDLELLPEAETGKGGGRTLHAAIIRPRAEPAAPMPVVLLIHGGGWAQGAYNDPHWLRTGFVLAEKGYFVASVEYRLSGEAIWPAQIQDCKLGVRWMRANAAKYHVDPNRIGCMGISAGGHLVACMGTMDNVPAFEGTGGYPGVSSRVQAVVDVSGPNDLVPMINPGVDGATTAGIKKAEQRIGALIGASCEEKPDLWKQASPMNHIAAHDPPFLLAYGDKDALVPLVQGTTFADALRKAGVPVDLVIDKNAGHVLGAVPGLPPPEIGHTAFGEKMAAFFDQAMKK